MKEPSGFFEVEMFQAEVDSPDHPYAAQLREMLENVAEEHQCTLLSFEVHEGTVIFSFDSDELTAEVVQIFQDRDESEP